VPPRAGAGSGSSARSEPAEGPLLAGITVTVFPGRSSRSLAGVAGVLLGWATGWGAARTGAEPAPSAATGAQTAASFTLGSRGMERRAVRCWIRRRWISTAEAISIPGACGTSVRSRCGTERAACSLASDPHPAMTATRAVSGNRKLVRMNPPRTERRPLRCRTRRRTSPTLPRLAVAIRDAASSAPSGPGVAMAGVT
jgi:hypothetical protein